VPARIGVIGAGFWAAYFYLPFLRDHPDAEIVGVVRRSSEALRALQESFPMEVATPNVQELLDRGCDGVIVASANDLHRGHAEAALNAGAHVLIEKPMTVTLDDARAVARVARERDRVVTLAYGWNYSRLAIWASEVVRSGVLGKPRWIMGQMASSLSGLFSGEGGYGVVRLGGFDFEASPDTWARPETGGGYAYGQLTHQLGVALRLVTAEPEVVYAQTNLGPSGVDLDVVVTVRFGGGAIGSFAGHGRLPWGTRYPLELRLAGERGVLTLDFERERADASLVKTSGTPPLELTEHHHPFSESLPDLGADLDPGEGLYSCEGPARFLVDLCNGSAPVDHAPAEVGVRSVAIVEAAVRSAREGRPVDIGSG
jgi:predicted dehydrogenase